MTVPKVIVIGVGRIGAVTAIGLAHLDADVTGLDRSAARVAALAGGRLPESEPGLRAALTAALRFRRLAFTVEATPGAYDLAFLCVDTPPLASGEPDLSQTFAAAGEAVRLLAPGGVLVTRSTVPVGTGDRLAALAGRLDRPDIEVVHVPEFLREGHAWEDFRQPDRLVVGGASMVAVRRVAALFAPLQRPVYTTDRRTAELAKYAANAFLATSISFANEIADLCDAASADGAAVFEVLRADRRIGPAAYLTPGLGFGGHCLPKDTEALAHTAAVYGQNAGLLASVRDVNRGRVGRVVAWLRRALGGLEGRRVCLAGVAFKAGTDDLRESPSLRLARALALEGATVTGWDPLVRDGVGLVGVGDSLEAALRHADALVICHAWEGWRELSPPVLRAVMRRPVLYDAPGLLDPPAWCEAGFVTNRRLPPQPSLLPARTDAA